MACRSSAISVNPCSEFEERSQILNIQSCLLHPSQCSRNANIAFLPLRNCPEIPDRLFWFGKCVVSNPIHGLRGRRSIPLAQCPFPISHPWKASICQCEFAWALLWAGERRHPLRKACSGVLCGSCCMERRDCQVRGWRNTAQTADLATGRNSLLLLTFWTPDNCLSGYDFPLPHALPLCRKAVVKINKHLKNCSEIYVT